MQDDKYFRNDFTLLISELIRKFKVLERDEKACFDITVSQRCTLSILNSCGPLTMKELSREMGVVVSTMTRVLDIMVRDGLVRRESSKRDRRVVRVKLTKKGRILADKLKKSYEDYFSSIFDEIPEGQKDEAISTLKTLIESFDNQRYSCQNDSFIANTNNKSDS
ncbi:MarR family winged helix-turn-helix transcriptional regulator [Thermodesulfobacteriota bacterium]